MHEMTETEHNPEVNEAGAEEDGPTVDELAGRLTDLQAAMDQLQAGDLDGAEATIASLEQALAEARQEHGLT